MASSTLLSISLIEGLASRTRVVDPRLTEVLFISSGGEGLRLLGGDGGFSRDEFRYDSTERLDTNRERCVVEEDIDDATSKSTRSNTSISGDDVVEVDATCQYRAYSAGS